MLPRSRFAPRARTDDEVVAAGAQRGDHVGDRRRIVGAVAVHEDDNVGVVGRLCAGEAGAAVTAAGFDRLRAGAARLRDGVVSAAAVGDDHAVDDSARQAGNDGGDQFAFVERRNDDGDAAGLERHDYRLQRKPQLAQAPGGLSDKSALRKSR